MGEEMDKKKKVGDKKRGAVEIRHGVAVSLVREKKRNYVKGIVLLFLYKQRVRVVGSLQCQNLKRRPKKKANNIAPRTEK